MGASAAHVASPSGILSSSTMIVMRIAITPSLNASIRPLDMPHPTPAADGAKNPRIRDSEIRTAHV